MDAQPRIEVFDSPVSESRDRVFKAFDRLQSGEALELVTSYEPKLFFEAFCEKYCGDFDWWRLEEGPEKWRVTMARRENSQTWSIADFLGTDHRRLGELWRDFLQQLRAGNLERVRSRLAEYLVGLRYHIRVEEEVLFPTFEARSGMRDAGPTAVMRHEHREIEAVLKKLAALTKAQDCGIIARTIQDQRLDPSALLRSHDAKEENVLYPMSDHMLNQNERRELILRMQAG